MVCPHYDCGWCYSKSDKTNDDQGACNCMHKCEEYKRVLREAKNKKT